MSTIPLELPLRASEAAALADAVFQQCEGRPLTDDLRRRLAARAASLELTSILPWWGSLQADPVHSTTFYLAADGLSHGRETPLLLRLAPASAPASGVFPNAMLIGRMRPGAGREMVVNAIPFGISDSEAIRTFAEKVDPAFLPRPHGAMPSVTLAPTGSLETEIPAAFAHYGRALKDTGINYAAFLAPYESVLWGAIRAGWRSGFSIAACVTAKEGVLGLVRYSRFLVEGLDSAGHEELFDLIRVEKMRAGLGRAFAYEVVHPENPAAMLEALREGGRAVQLIAPAPDYDLEVLAELTRRHNVTLSFTEAPDHDAAWRRRVAQATIGRWNYSIAAASAIPAVVADFRGA
ncbi:MAG: hypothetical protein R2729_22550 [Bryobacteraceae bacterium]